MAFSFAWLLVIVIEIPCVISTIHSYELGAWMGACCLLENHIFCHFPLLGCSDYGRNAMGQQYW